MGIRHTTGVVLVLAAISIALALGIACGVDKETHTSPLATWDPGNAEVFNLTRTEGMLEFSPSCVRLILDNQESVLLVWPEPTSWNASYNRVRERPWRTFGAARRRPDRAWGCDSDR